MVIGNGMIAKAFEGYKDIQDVIIFASGVSNSKEVVKNEFDREMNLVKETLKSSENTLFVYFSTCSVYDTYFPRTQYIQHKLEIENIIASSHKNHLIIRLPQVIGYSENKKQLVNFLCDRIKNDTEFQLYNIERNIIDVDDVFLIVDQLIKQGKLLNTIVNVANVTNIKVLDLVESIKKVMNKNAKYTIVELEGSLIIDTKKMQSLVNIEKKFTNNYILNLLQKYCVDKDDK